MASSSNKGKGGSATSGRNGLLEDLSEPDYDHLLASSLQMADDDNDEGSSVSSSSEDSLGKPRKPGEKTLKASSSKVALYPAYILGTLVVRVVAARDLEPARGGGGGNLGGFFFGKGSGGGSANPYASVKFGGSTQRTSELYDTLDPVWPRGETMFMDVSLPLSKVSHPDPTLPATGEIAENNDNDAIPPDLHSSESSSYSCYSQQHNNGNNNNNNHKDNVNFLDIPRPILTVAVFSTSEMGKAHKSLFTKDDPKYPSKKQHASGDSDDDFLGMASIDLTQLLTGKKALVDTWLPLVGVGGRGSIRIVCEYEATDVSPYPGDLVRFTRFCHPADIHPLVPGSVYPVQEVLDNDNLLLTYTTPEGWVCSFVVHRFMLICTERHHDAIGVARNEWRAFTEKLSYSPLIGTVSNTVERLPDEGLFAVGADALKGGASLFGRWLEEGLDAVVKDVAFATNWDGQFNSQNRMERPTTQLSPAAAAAADSNSSDSNSGGLVVEGSSEGEEQCLSQEEKKPPPLALDPDPTTTNKTALPNMPSCPITGEPMLDPVVAADGHTYERAAIARWLKESDKSPLTGSVLPHKELVPNYGLLSSLQEQADSAAKSAPSSNGSSRNAGDEPVPEDTKE